MNLSPTAVARAINMNTANVRRVLWISLGVVVATVPVGVLTVMQWLNVPTPVGRGAALWVTLTFEIVFAIYKWGVGDGSRYTPPQTTDTTSQNDKPGATPPATRPA